MISLRKRIFVILLVVLLILSVILIAMQFTDQVNWDLFDFIIMGILLFGTGLLLDLIIRKAGHYRVIGVVVVILLFLYLWAELAVGIFTNWGS